MTLRETIREALGDKWTQELEDQLFWPISRFVNKAVELNLQELRKEILSKLDGIFPG